MKFLTQTRQFSFNYYKLTLRPLMPQLTQSADYPTPQLTVVLWTHGQVSLRIVTILTFRAVLYLGFSSFQVLLCLICFPKQVHQVSSIQIQRTSSMTSNAITTRRRRQQTKSTPFQTYGTARAVANTRLQKRKSFTADGVFIQNI